VKSYTPRSPRAWSPGKATSADLSPEVVVWTGDALPAVAAGDRAPPGVLEEGSVEDLDEHGDAVTVLAVADVDTADTAAVAATVGVEPGPAENPEPASKVIDALKASM